MEENRLTVSISIMSVIKILILLLIVWFVVEIKEVIIILFLALLISAILEPLVKYLTVRKIPKVIAAVVVYLVIIGFVGTIISLMVVPINEQFQELGTAMPVYIEKIASGEVLGLKTLSENDPYLFAEIIKELKSVQSAMLSMTTTSVYSSITSLIGGLFGFVVVLVISFYLIVEEESLKKTVKMIVPAHYQPYLVQLLRKIQNKIGYWARAYLLMAGIVWILSFTVLMILGIPYALILSLIAAFTEIVPMVGPLIAAIPAVFIAFFAKSPLVAVFVFIGYEIINMIESHILIPKIMQKAVGLNPVFVILVVLIGARLGGIMGILLAIPVTTAISVFIADFFPEDKAIKLEEI